MFKRKKNLKKGSIFFLPFPELWPGTPCTVYDCKVSKQWAFIRFILENLGQKTNLDLLHRPQAIVCTLF